MLMALTSGNGTQIAFYPRYRHRFVTSSGEKTYCPPNRAGRFCPVQPWEASFDLGPCGLTLGACHPDASVDRILALSASPDRTHQGLACATGQNPHPPDTGKPPHGLVQHQRDTLQRAKRMFGISNHPGRNFEHFGKAQHRFQPIQPHPCDLPSPPTAPSRCMSGGERLSSTRDRLTIPSAPRLRAGSCPPSIREMRRLRSRYR